MKKSAEERIKYYAANPSTEADRLQNAWAFQVPTHPTCIWEKDYPHMWIKNTSSTHLPVIREDRTLLFIERSDKILYSSSRLHALSENGEDEILYEFNDQSAFGGKLQGSLTCMRDGCILLTEELPVRMGSNTEDPCAVICLYPSGSVKWIQKLRNPIKARPVLDQEDNSYFFSFTHIGKPIGTLWCINKDGILKWKREFPSNVDCPPVIVPSGIMYLALIHEKKLVAIGRDGESLWSKEYPILGLDTSILPDGNGQVYLATDNVLYALSPDGDMQWVYRPQEVRVLKQTALSADGTLLVHLSDFRMVRLSKEGKELQTTETRGFADLPTIVDAAGSVICVTHSPAFSKRQSWVEVFSDKLEKQWDYEVDGDIVSVLPVNKQTMFILSMDDITRMRKSRDSFNMNLVIRRFGDT